MSVRSQEKNGYDLAYLVVYADRKMKHSHLILLLCHVTFNCSTTHDFPPTQVWVWFKLWSQNLHHMQCYNHWVTFSKSMKNHFQIMWSQIYYKLTFTCLFRIIQDIAWTTLTSITFTSPIGVTWLTIISAYWIIKNINFSTLKHIILFIGSI